MDDGYMEVIWLYGDSRIHDKTELPRILVRDLKNCEILRKGERTLGECKLS